MRARFLLPQFWPMWIALGLTRVLASLPFGVALRLGSALGAFARVLRIPQVRTARTNLALSLPQLAPAERERVLRDHFRSVGMTIAETSYVWWADQARVRALARFEGLETLDAITRSGRGAILLAAHFTTLEIAAGLLTLTRNAHAVYKPSGNALLTEVLVARRAKVTVGIIARDDIRAMVRVLKAGGIVWYAPDQAYRGKGAQMVPLFGIPAATNTATSRLARLTGAAVLPYFAERLSGGVGYRLRIGPELAGVPSDDPIADTAQFHSLIEAEVRRIPEQYLWIHKRFKGLDETYPDPYRPGAQRDALSSARAPGRGAP
jgi:Kdo2-lipid IVA lauroyltransferase/acyltransferase